MTEEEARARIDAEFVKALQARRAGNEGMVRVCARRAAGVAIGFWLDSHPGHDWGTDALRLLRGVMDDEAFPASVREAALRLTARVNLQFASPYETDPLDDSRIIVRYFLEGR